MSLLFARPVTGGRTVAENWIKYPVQLGMDLKTGVITKDMTLFSSDKLEVYCMSKDSRLAVLANACQVMMPKMILIKASKS